MTAKTELSAPKRRTRAEVQQLVDGFVSSGIRPSEFCQSTLDRHLKKRVSLGLRNSDVLFLRFVSDPGSPVIAHGPKKTAFELASG